MIVLDSDKVHIFSELGDHLSEFNLVEGYAYPRIAFHNSSEHVVITGQTDYRDLYVKIYTKDGTLVRSTQINEGENCVFL